MTRRRWSPMSMWSSSLCAAASKKLTTASGRYLESHGRHCCKNCGWISGVMGDVHCCWEQGSRTSLGSRPPSRTSIRHRSEDQIDSCCRRTLRCTWYRRQYQRLGRRTHNPRRCQCRIWARALRTRSCSSHWSAGSCCCSFPQTPRPSPWLMWLLSSRSATVNTICLTA